MNSDSSVEATGPEVDPSAPRAQPAPAPRWAGPLIGLVAAGAAVGVGMFTAAIIDVDSPLDAVGSEFIDHTPKWLKNLAIDLFGTNDKVALRVGIVADHRAALAGGRRDRPSSSRGRRSDHRRVRAARRAGGRRAGRARAPTRRSRPCSARSSAPACCGIWRGWSRRTIRRSETPGRPPRPFRLRPSPLRGRDRWRRRGRCAADRRRPSPRGAAGRRAQRRGPRHAAPGRGCRHRRSRCRCGCRRAAPSTACTSRSPQERRSARSRRSSHRTTTST